MAEEQRALARTLTTRVDLFTLDWPHVPGSCSWQREQWTEYLTAIDPSNQTVWNGRPILAVIAPDSDPALLDVLLPMAMHKGIHGIVVDDGILLSDGCRHVGPAALPTAIATVRHARRLVGQAAPIVAGSIAEPADVILLLSAGADAVQVTSGLIYAGPALVRRTGETILAARAADAKTYEHQTQAPAQHESMGDKTNMSGAQKQSASGTARGLAWHEDWLWAGLLGIGMVVAGALAWLVAVVRVILPYDEAFLGLTRAQMERANPYLLSFMAHDRVTLAGTMISIGILYSGLGFGPMRRGERWARRAFITSAGIGFASFALVLGYRYVDPLHALATLALLPLFVLMLRSRTALSAAPRADPYNDGAWLRAQWGQLSLIALGIGFVVGGIAISTVGVTDVFVREDLAYLRTTATALNAVNRHLIPVIAHDRAGFGGALISDGTGFFLTALWGIRRGASWVWRTLLFAGLPGFIAAIGVHLAVGYDNPWHLAPVGLALVLWVTGLALCYSYCRRAICTATDLVTLTRRL